MKIIAECNLLSLILDGHIYMEVQKGMYGLRSSVILANHILTGCLVIRGYQQAPFTPGLWTHITHPIIFSLVVDDFGVHFVGRDNAQHLIISLQETYEVSIDWYGSLYCGITPKWNYVNKTFDLSMHGYI
jgi:hypothetical protein